MMKKRIVFLLVFLIFLLQNVLYAQKTIIIGENFEYKNLGQAEIYVFQDKERELTFEQILEPQYQAQFKPLQSNNANFGYFNGNSWLKIQVQKNTQTPAPFFFEVSYATLDSITFFYQNEKKAWETILLGDQIPFSQRIIQHKNSVFPIQISENTLQTYYFKVHSSGTILIPITLYTANSLRVEEVRHERFYLFFYGSLLVMFTYNFFLFIALKDYNYLIYSIAVLFNVLLQAALLGHTLYFWGDWLWWVNSSTAFLINISILFLLLFNYSFLSLKNYNHWLWYVAVFMIGLAFLLTIMSLWADYGLVIRISVVMVIVSSLFMLFSGIYVWAKGQTSARFYVLAWITYLLGIILMALRSLGILPDIFLTRHALTIGSMLEVVLISFALADRINLYRKEKEEAQKLALQKSQENEKIIQEQNKELERQVRERTAQYRHKQGELMLRNEELNQQQEEIMAQRNFIEEKSKVLEAQNKKIKSSIEVAKTIQEAVLPYSQKLDALLKEYFVLYRPKDVVSGDFYWLNHVHESTILVVLDCTGHGVPGAFMSLIANTLLDKIIRVWQITNPAQILDKLHEEVRVTLKQKYHGNNMGMDASVIAWKEKADGFELTFAGAKESIYYILPQTSELLALKGTRKSIGGIQNETTQFENQICFLPKNTAVYVGTDGYADQNNLYRKRITEARLKNMLVENVEKPFVEQHQVLAKNLDDFMKGTTQRDDILLIGFKLH